MSNLMSHFAFFSGESTKLSSIMSEWQEACKRCDVDNSGDIDEQEGGMIWREIVGKAREENERQLKKLKEWRRKEMEEQDGGVVDLVLKAKKK